MIWTDKTFRRYGPGIFTPYLPEQVRQHAGLPCKSYGQSSCGYDIRCSGKWSLPVRESRIVDLRDLESVRSAWQDVECGFIAMPPHGIALAESLEHIAMPRNAMALAIGKSSDARRGVAVYITPLEPAWAGHLVIEIVNHSPHTQILRAGEGIAQLVFFWLDGTVQIAYDERESAYQGQSGVTLARL